MAILSALNRFNSAIVLDRNRIEEKEKSCVITSESVVKQKWKRLRAFHLEQNMAAKSRIAKPPLRDHPHSVHVVSFMTDFFMYSDTKRHVTPEASPHEKHDTLLISD